VRGDRELSERTYPGRRLDPETLGDHVDWLYRAARGLCGSCEESEDLVQETFARVLRKPRMLHSPDDRGYLLRTLRNTFVSTRRSESLRPRTAAHSDLLGVLEDPNAAQPEARLRTGELFAVIAALPPDFRDAIVAIDVMGLSYREAARALRVRETTIATRLHRGRDRIANAMSEPIPG
jgi:RNA polymerase sigma-70 factor (ECF subfamily)